MAHEKILIVDGALSNRRSLEAVLRLQGYELFKADSGQEGIDLAIRERPDLILIELRLPDIDGYMVAKVLKSRTETRAIPLIALAADAAPEDIQRATEAGCADCISKPFNATAFPEVIAALLKQHATDNN
jgi:two-component system cell cycle response regulator DivK